MVRRPLLAAALAALVALLAVPVADAKNRFVRVGDDFFGPARVTVKPDTTIVWRWYAGNRHTHDVRLVRAPKRVKRFHSDFATSDFSYRRKLTRRGTYRLLCTIHSGQMKQTIVVR